ncbi:MAG: thiamine pyrophosphate-dependent enzyme [Patescibacteria group bacterium]
MSNQAQTKNRLTISDYSTPMIPTWCPGCGNFGILMALKQALVELQIQPHQALVVWGIGCNSNMCNWLNVYGIHALHGRALPVAAGAKFVNPKLTVIAIGGDGDGYGIGLGHFIHSCRRNLDITYIVHNNQIYGLTAGQASPTSDHGAKTKSTPCGVIERPINPIALALSSQATYIARGIASDVAHLKGLIMAGIQHRGFALIDVLQPCVTWNKQNTYEWVKERVYKIEAQNSRLKAQKYAEEWGDKIPVGLFYQEERKIYSDEFDHLKKDECVIEHDISQIDISGTLEEFV